MIYTINQTDRELVAGSSTDQQTLQLMQHVRSVSLQLFCMDIRDRMKDTDQSQ